MRQVFVTKCEAAWEVIDKTTGQVIDVIDDVLIFNGEYRRYKNKRGWHGILSEEINRSIIDVVNTTFTKLICKVTPYYPRLTENGSPIKKVGYVKFKENDVSIATIGCHLNLSKIHQLCTPWEEEYEDDIDEYDDGLDDEEDPWDPNQFDEET